MIKNSKHFIFSMMLLILFYSLASPVQAEAGYNLVKSYAPQETAVFIDGTIRILEQKLILLTMVIYMFQ